MTDINKDWTKERIKEYKKLGGLVRTIASINNGNLFVEKISAAIKTANELCDSDFDNGKLSFLDFLEDRVIIDIAKGEEEK